MSQPPAGGGVGVVDDPVSVPSGEVKKALEPGPYTLLPLERWKIGLADLVQDRS